MPVFQRKNRMISFRLSEEEYERLRKGSLADGARSVSDYARLVLCRVVSGDIDLRPDPATARIDQIDRRMNELGRELQRLVQLVENSPRQA